MVLVLFCVPIGPSGTQTSLLATVNQLFQELNKLSFFSLAVHYTDIPEMSILFRKPQINNTNTRNKSARSGLKISQRCLIKIQKGRGRIVSVSCFFVEVVIDQ
jgi:hypothetical protein